MTNNQRIHKKLKNILKELDSLSSIHTEYRDQIIKIHKKMDVLLEKISIEIICDEASKRQNKGEIK